MDADEAGVAALWREAFPNEPSHNEPSQVIRCKKAVQPDLFLVARVDGKVVGTVLAGYDGHRGWIHKLAVSTRYRRQQIGAELLRRAELVLSQMGCPKVNLQVRASNLDVIQFYERLGYAIEDRISMGKRLK